MKRIQNRGAVVGTSLSVAVLWLAGLTISAFSPPFLLADDASLARAVRLSSVDGQVRLLFRKQVVADQAVPNMPLFEGTEVVTGDDGRAEIQFEDGSVARLSPNSSFALTVLRGQGNAGDAEVNLEGGLGYFELQGSGQAGSIRIKFGDSVVTAASPTVVRIDLDNPPGTLSVFSGNAHVERGSTLALDLRGGESVTMSSTGQSRYDLAESIEPDSWDVWNSDRDQELSSTAAMRTDAENGSEDSGNQAWNDLDANGSWYNVPDQGAVWSPNDAANSDWDPYGNGYWLTTPVFGATWVSSYGWGYLPYHCGKWNYYNSFGWGWAPGAGGCSPWWRHGHYGGPNIGTGFAGYRPPQPPRRHIYDGQNGANGGATTGLVAVNRRPISGPGALPARDRSTAVVIAGHMVQPVREQGVRQRYDRVGSASITHTASGYTITNQGPTTSTGPGFIVGTSNSRGSNYSSGSGYSGSRPTILPAPRGSGSVSSSSSSPAPRSSGGGGSPSSSPAPRSFESGGSQHSSAPVSHSSSGGGPSGGGYSGGGGGGNTGGGGGGGFHGGGVSPSGAGGMHR